jgi:hypothetical protein
VKNLDYFKDFINNRINDPEAFLKLIKGDRGDTFAYQVVDTWDYKCLYLLNKYTKEENKLLLTAIKEYNKEKWLSRGAIKNPKFVEMSKAVAEIKELGFQVSICRSRDYFSLDNEQTGYMIIVWDVFSNFHPKLMTFSRQLKTLVAVES